MKFEIVTPPVPRPEIVPTTSVPWRSWFGVVPLTVKPDPERSTMRSPKTKPVVISTARLPPEKSLGTSGSTTVAPS